MQHINQVQTNNRNAVGSPQASKGNRNSNAMDLSNSDPLGNNRRMTQPINRAKSNENFIGVPPDLTESSHKLGPPEDFDDEEDENDVQNNYLT